MRVVRLSLAWFFAVACVVASSAAVEPSKTELAAARRWFEAKFNATEPAGLPFSFTYGGRSSTELLGTSKVASADRKNARGEWERTISFADSKTNLAVTCVATLRADLPTIHWMLRFKNAGAQDTPILENVKVLDADVGSELTQGSARLHHAKGSHALIGDFEPLETALAPGTRVELSSFGGRSSDGSLPFFNVAYEQGGGTAVDVGWTGQWSASFAKTIGDSRCAFDCWPMGRCWRRPSANAECVFAITRTGIFVS